MSNWKITLRCLKSNLDISKLDPKQKYLLSIFNDTGKLRSKTIIDGARIHPDAVVCYRHGFDNRPIPKLIHLAAI